MLMLLPALLSLSLLLHAVAMLAADYTRSLLPLSLCLIITLIASARRERQPLFTYDIAMLCHNNSATCFEREMRVALHMAAYGAMLIAPCCYVLFFRLLIRVLLMAPRMLIGFAAHSARPMMR